MACLLIGIPASSTTATMIDEPTTAGSASPEDEVGPAGVGEWKRVCPDAVEARNPTGRHNRAIHSSGWFMASFRIIQIAPIIVSFSFSKRSFNCGPDLDARAETFGSVSPASLSTLLLGSRSASGVNRVLWLANLLGRAHRKELVVLKRMLSIVSVMPKIEIQFGAGR